MSCVDYHESSWTRLKWSVQCLAAEADVQLSIYGEFGGADELALDFDHWLEVCQRFMTPEQEQALSPIDSLLDGMSGPDGPWDNEHLRRDARWTDIRTLAKSALDKFGWLFEDPPPSPEFFGPLGS